MNIEEVRAFALGICPEVTEELFADEWISWRIGGKWFLLMQLDAPEPRVAVREGDCVYGKFFAGKAGFVSREWWPDLYNWRRSQSTKFDECSVEGIILATLQENCSMITRDLRAACGFVGPNMRSKFDGYITRLEMSCHIVTEDFVYPTDKHGREYGFGWSLLTTPECLLGLEACRYKRHPEESYKRMYDHLSALLPEATEKQIKKILK